jgi:hypothetical protein
MTRLCPDEKVPARGLKIELEKDLLHSENFEISFQVRLQEISDDPADILQLSWGGRHDSHLPCISVVPGSTQLVAHVEHDTSWSENDLVEFSAGRDLEEATPSSHDPSPPSRLSGGRSPGSASSSRGSSGRS